MSAGSRPLRRKLFRVFVALGLLGLLLVGVTGYTIVQWRETEETLSRQYVRSLRLQEVRALAFEAFTQVPAAVRGEQGARTEYETRLEPLGRAFDEWAALLSTVTGWDVTADELHATAQRIVLAKRAYNLREGWQPEDDWLPERFLTEELTVGSGRTAALTPKRLRAMVDGYWAARGLDEQGRPRPA